MEDVDGAAEQLVLSGVQSSSTVQLVDQFNRFCKEWCSIN